MKFLYFILLFTFTLFAQTDQDIDGVLDSEDLCPNTSFDTIVNAQGCAHHGTFTLQIGKDFSFNTISKRINNTNVYLNYTYNLWDISLSSSNYNVTNIPTISETEDSLYLAFGHTFNSNSLTSKISLGTKFSFMDDTNNSKNNDFFTSLNFDYSVSQRNNIFLHYTYTISGDSKNVEYQNFHSLSMGMGYAINNKWYSALSYNYVGSSYEVGTSYKAISWFNYYALPNDFYISCNYARTLNNYPYNHSISLNVGMQF